MRKTIRTILKSIIFFVGWAIFISFTPDLPIKNNALLRLWWEFTPLAGIILLTLIFIYLIEKSEIKIPIKQRFHKNTFIGIAFGILWILTTVIIFLVTNIMNINGHNHIEYIWIWMLASLLNVAMQELLVRGYLYQLWKRKFNFIVATIITTVLFTALHGGAFEAGIVPVLNVVTMSLFVTLLLEYTGSIIAPIIVHFIWNSIGSIILGGVSLANDYPHLLNSTFQGNPWLSGGIYKLEGSIIVLLINILLIIYLVGLTKRSKIV